MATSDPAPLAALRDAGHVVLAGHVADVAAGRERQYLIPTATQLAAYRAHVAPGTTGTRLWTDPTVGTYVVLDD